MAFVKILPIVCVFVVAFVGCQSAPAGSYGQQPYHGDYYEDRDYRFNYGVHDDYTYNHQTRDEQKYGNTVTGQYTVLEPTGQLRVVNYIADDYGFRADVQHKPYGNGGTGSGNAY